MGTKNNPGKFDCYANAAPDEPIFILLGRDPDAPETVRFWAERRKLAIEDGLSTDTMAKVNDAHDCAMAMGVYQLRGNGAAYRQLAERVSQVPVNALSLHGTLNGQIQNLVGERESDYLRNLGDAARLLPASWTLHALTRTGPIWYASASYPHRRNGVLTGYGYTECAARTAMGLLARAYDLDHGR